MKTPKKSTMPIVLAATLVLGSGAWLYAIPILGQVLLMRDVVGGTASAPEAVIATASAIVSFVVLVRFSGDRLSDDRRLARAIR